MLKFIKINLDLLLIIIFSLCIYLPFFINSSIILERNNDLSEFFLPIIYYVKNNITNNGVFPLWNNLILSGTPLLPDPQSPLFYFPNIIFLLLPLPISFLLSIYLHVLFASICMYFLLNKGFNISKRSSLYGALVFLILPRLGSYIEAGHLGLIQSYPYIPLVFLSTILYTKVHKFIFILITSIALSAIYFTHSLTFLIISTSLLVFIFYKIKSQYNNAVLFLIYLFTTGIISITLLPQLEWIPSTTRTQLLTNPEIYPAWNNFIEFFQMLFVPYFNGFKYLSIQSTEKYVSWGLILPFFGLLGYLKIKFRYKISILLVFIAFTLVALGTSSPIFSYLIRFDWYKTLRVSTRVWIVPTLVIVVLATKGLDYFSANNNKFLTKFLVFTMLLELLFIFVVKFTSPISISSTLPKSIYSKIKTNNKYERIFCLNRCIPQREAAINNLQLIDGYNTLVQQNYNRLAWQLTGKYWNYYSLSIPPMGIYAQEKIIPDVETLSKLNVSYIISPYSLFDKNIDLEYFEKGYYVYKTSNTKGRAYYLDDNLNYSHDAEIILYSPNNITVKIDRSKSKRLVLSEIYSSGWKAFNERNINIPILERSDSLRLVDIPNDTNFINFVYLPKSFVIGASITLITVSLILMFVYWHLKTYFIRSKFDKL